MISLLRSQFGRMAAVALTAGPLSASPASAETINEAVQRGLSRHPEVRLAEARINQASTEVDMARNGYLPTLTSSAGPDAGGVSYDVNLAQTVYDWGATGRAVDQRRALLMLQQANLQVVRDDAALEIVETYLDIASARAELSLLEEQRVQLDALATTARTRVEARYSDLSETGRVELALSTVAGSRARIQGDLAQAVDRYELLVGSPPGSVRAPSSPEFLDSLRDAGALEAAVVAAPLLRKANMAVDAADAGLREAQAARFPRLNVEGSLQRREIGGRMVDDSFVGLRLRLSSQQGLSAFQRPQLEAQRREAARWEAQVVARDLRRLVGSLIQDDASLALRITALEAQAGQAEAVRDLYREQFLVGRRDIQDLVIMETESFEARRQVLELTIERLRLQYRAAAQLGLLASAAESDAIKITGAPS